jgi:hypothetical protein
VHKYENGHCIRVSCHLIVMHSVTHRVVIALHLSVISGRGSANSHKKRATSKTNIVPANMTPSVVFAAMMTIDCQRACAPSELSASDQMMTGHGSVTTWTSCIASLSVYVQQYCKAHVSVVSSMPPGQPRQCHRHQTLPQPSAIKPPFIVPRAPEPGKAEGLPWRHGTRCAEFAAL